MSQCSTCKVLLTEENAYKKKEKGKTRLYSYCKTCFNNICKKRWIDRKIKAIEYMGGKCQKCGYNKSVSALEFHHLDPTQKEADWRKIRQWSWDKVERELNKCILVCANCHREIHHE